MIFPSKQSGFTLVELLVVMTIIITATGLAGGLVVDGVTKFRAKAEIQDLEQTFILASSKAFVLEKRLSIKLSENQMQIYSGKSQVFEKTFNYLMFSETDFNVNRLGLIDANRIELAVNGMTKTIYLDEIYNDATTN
ncbi:pilus assembly FimT family protein [Planctobacterium marinum]|uniref:Uncharacterized protein n=1 Tax=Planctobacterium marinum TaxID=1631968 RepID=A0AA48HXH8_9ALTE|nr:hypothetical protein MACH26_32140 [Planctobacterium marinum]